MLFTEEYAEEMEKSRTEALKALNVSNADLLDLDLALQEVQVKNPVFAWSEHFASPDVELDEFDWAGLKIDANDLTVAKNYIEPSQFDSLAFFQSVEAVISNGFFWEIEQDEYSLSAEFKMSLGLIPRSKGQVDVNKLLHQFDRLPSNAVDVLSSDDTIFESNYKVVSNFEINVPLEVYSEAEDWVIKANLPDIVFNNTSSDEKVFPDGLNFKSVLALLPDRINTRHLQPTFVNGQFHLELPKREELKTRKVK